MIRTREAARSSAPLVCAPLLPHVTTCRRRVDVQLATQKHVRTPATNTHAIVTSLYVVVRVGNDAYRYLPANRGVLSPIMARCPLHLVSRGEIIKRVECRRRRSALRDADRGREKEGETETDKERERERENECEPSGICIVCTRSSHAAARN